MVPNENSKDRYNYLCTTQVKLQSMKGNLAHLIILAAMWSRVGRSIVIVLGIMLALFSALVKEDEAGHIQSRLDQLWRRIDALSTSALAKHTVFLRETLAFFSAGVDRIYGRALLSVQAVAVTLSFSVASFLLLLAFWKQRYLPTTYSYPLTVLMFVGIFMLIGFGPTFVAGGRISRYWPWGMLVAEALFLFISSDMISNASLGWGIFDATRNPPLWKTDVRAFTVFSAGIGCDLGCVSINRALIKRSASSTSSYTILLLLLLNIIIGCGYLFPYLRVPEVAPYPGAMYMQAQSRTIVQLISSTNLVSALLALSIVPFLLLVLLHRWFWPLIERPIFVMYERQIVRQHKLTFVIGILMVLLGIFGWQLFLEKLANL
ncbi:MAG TPA: hypothetical protein VGQ12_10915 [Candidatus Angelobacter sp.]|jgi:hypothetical protein|nr:hypothetical protein [Candidatus Angelobacter sp.]